MSQGTEARAKTIALIRLKTTLATVHSIIGFATSYNPEVNNLNQVRVRLDEMSSLQLSFEDQQSEIEMLELKSNDECIAERISFKELIRNAKSSLMEILEVNEKPSIPSPSYSTNSNAGLKPTFVKLPPINIPKFDGNWQQWTAFIDAFNATFHNNSSLAPVQRFQYLRSCLDGPASDVIMSLPTTAENYQKAYDILVQRYENKNAIIQSHIRALFDTPKVKEPSAADLQKLYHHVMSNVHALESLNQPIEHWDAWLVTLVCSRMDSSTVGEWQLHYNKKDLPTFESIMVFLSNRTAAYEAGDINTLSLSTSKRVQSRFVGNKMPERNVLLATQTEKAKVPLQCILCKEPHRLYHCKQFNDMSVDNRRLFVKNKRLCFKCLNFNHQALSCRFSDCSICHRRHNHKLHHDFVDLSKEGSKEDVVHQQNDQVKDNICMYTNHCTEVVQEKHVLLATAVINVISYDGVPHACRAVLDSGSQINIITNECARKIGLMSSGLSSMVTGVCSAGMPSMQLAPVTMSSRRGDFKMSVIFHSLPTISSEIPTCAFNIDELKLPNNVKYHLADPKFAEPGPIDVLIGAELYGQLFTGSKHVISDLVSMFKTRLGWICIGSLPVPVGNRLVLANKCSDHALDVESHVENPIITSSLALSITKQQVKGAEEAEAELHFQNNYYRNSDGRFVVRLPICKAPIELGSSRHMALKRFLNLEQRLLKDKHLSTEYHKFMSDYLSLGHMESVPICDVALPSYYLPHHTVLKENSVTTKLRVVFDGSALASSGKSLNDILLRGPTIQSDLLSTLLRFRTHQIAITADIEKMYRQISVAQEDRDMQRILYRRSPDEPICDYRLTTVTYGTKSASFLATRCLNQVGCEAKNEQVKNIILNDFYVDDLLTGAQTIDECYDMFKQITEVMDNACLPLRKWCSSSSEVLDRITSLKREENYSLQLNDTDTASALGLTWRPSTDCFSFVFKPWSPPSKMTKRTLLSDINRIFDPLGLISPVLIKGKIYLQQLWSLKLGWDSTLSSDLQSRWHNFYEGLNALEKLSIPRRVIADIGQGIQVHGFCDASQEAFGACIYVRTRSVNGNCVVRLYTSKSRVAPMRPSTIPRLELCGATLLSDLLNDVLNEIGKLSIQIPDDHVYLWTDSTIVLAWINADQPLKSYISNRVAKILDNTRRSQWRHVQTHKNPADLISRGEPAHLFGMQSLWWNGPDWLELPELQWPISFEVWSQELPETRPIKLVLLASCRPTYIIDRYSDLTRLLRITAWLCKFISVLKGSKSKNLNSLSVSEIADARMLWIGLAQTDEFSEEISALKKGNPVSSRSKIKCLSPFLDEKGILRVGGRLSNASITYNERHPILLPFKCKITRLIFEYEHKRLFHVGPQALLSIVHQHYWPLRGRSLAKTTVHKCIRCFRHNPKPVVQFMAPLPRLRVELARPFAKSGVDFCGPIYVKSGIRKVAALKAYISVFVCFVTRAVHLELVMGLTSEAFLAAMKRFMSRRGQPLQMFSDNGTNFIGANKELQGYFRSGKVQVSLTSLGVEWHFIPPGGPHFGGLWEAAVKSAKRHLYKITNGNLFTYEETTTFLCQVEAVLNSRPLTPLCSDPSDLNALTPAHFLVGSVLICPPEPDSTCVPDNRLKRWQLLKKQTQLFWNRWFREYLPQLQKRGRWLSPSREIKVGDLAVLKDESLAPMKWPLVRVVKIHPGNDGSVRVVTIRGEGGHEFKRPVVKLALLPTEKDEANLPEDSPQDPTETE